MWTAYFTLRKASPVEASSLIDGLNVQIREGSTELLVDGASAMNEHEAVEKASAAAHAFLNELSWKYGVIIAFDCNTQRVEYVDAAGQRHTSISVGNGAVGIEGKVSVVKKDALGNVIEVRDSQKLGKIEVKPSDAAAYFRQAHLTDDPFDRFRNLYLVAENIASRIVIKKEFNKRILRQTYGLKSYEESLLRLALDQCFAGNLQHLRSIYSVVGNQPSIPALVETLFKGHRCQLNHSKESQNRKVPFNPQDKKDVEAALPLMEFVAKSLLEYQDKSL